MENKKFIDLWNELEDVPFGENQEGIFELEEDFYECKRGSTQEGVWAYLEAKFEGLIIGDVLNNIGEWEEKYGDLTGQFKASDI